MRSKTSRPLLRYVALPYGRGGIVGGIMLGLGRALGETIAVFFVIKIVFDPVNYYQILESGGGSVATLIVARWNGDFDLSKASEVLAHPREARSPAEPQAR